MLNHSLGGNSSLGTCRFTPPWLVDASIRNGASPPGRPAQDYAGFLDSSANEFLGQLARPQRPALVHLARILAAERSAADRHARSVVINNKFLSRKPVVTLGAADREFLCAVEDKFISGER